MNLERLAARGAAACAAASLLCSCGLQEDLSQRPDTSGVAQAAAITAPTLAGIAYDWSATRGHVVVLDFWASWCGPCRAEQPGINALAAQYMPRGVIFLGIDMRNDDHASATAYARDRAVRYPSVADADEVVASAYDVAGPPTIIVIDKQGEVVDRFLSTLSGLGADLSRLG